MVAVALALVLAACGGGGGDTAQAPPPPAAEIVITSFTPAQGAPGTVVSVTGSGFTGVGAARVGGVAAAFTVASATAMQVTVPPTAASGRIELSGTGRVALSATDFTVMAVAQAAAVTPSTLLPPGRITVTGSNLNLVSQVRMGTTVLPIVTQTATSLVLDVPAGTTTAVLTLVGTDTVARPSTLTVTTAAPMAVASLNPSSLLQGATLTVNGSNLNRVQAVEFAGGASAPVASRSGSTSINVVVPATAASGPIVLVGDLGDRVTSSAGLTVVPQIRVTNAAAFNVTAGAAITLQGSGLSQVASVVVGGTAATIGSRSDTQLSFTVPAGVSCGAIALFSSTQPTVSAGSVVVGNGCVVQIASVEVAQVLSQDTSDSRQRLVPGKETWIRAYVTSDASGTTALGVRVTGLVGGNPLGTVTLSGPATLPMLAAGAAVPTTLRYDESQTFNAELPASWIVNGLSLRVEADTVTGPPVTVTRTPAVGTQTRVIVVIVPVVSGTFAPTMPATSDVVAELIRRLPIPADRISVTLRAPYTLTSVTDGLDTDTEWSNALSELNQLRQREGPANSLYYGFVRRSGGGIAGIGYVGAPASLGWDSASGWRRTFTHELGHNFGRSHAPCGGVASSDPNYPYAGGAMGAAPLFESLLNDFQAPTGGANGTDVMGYCGGGWFSDYNYRAVQGFLEARPQTSIEFAAQASELIRISGSIGLDGLRLDPVEAMTGIAQVPAAGEYQLRLLLASGTQVDVPVEAFEVDHAMPPQKHFSVLLPNPGRLASVQLTRGGRDVPLAAAETVAAQTATTRGVARSAPFVDWSEQGGQLVLRWNAQAHPVLSVTHLADGGRTVLALRLRGGVARLPLEGLAAGGSFEFGLSDGLNAERITVAR
jgi:hypothetical protein